MRLVGGKWEEGQQAYAEKWRRRAHVVTVTGKMRARGDSISISTAITHQTSSTIKKQAFRQPFKQSEVRSQQFTIKIYQNCKDSIVEINFSDRVTTAAQQ